MTIFVDSSVWFSAVFAKDARHALAKHDDFLVYRYGTGRERAFEVLR